MLTLMEGSKKISPKKFEKKVFKMNNWKDSIRKAKEYAPAPVGPKDEDEEVRSKEFGHLEDSMAREIENLIVGLRDKMDDLQNWDAGAYEKIWQFQEILENYVYAYQVQLGGQTQKGKFRPHPRQASIDRTNE